MADTLFAYGRAISQNNYANKLRMLKLLHLVLRPYQIAKKCCICLRNVDLAKGRKEMEGGKTPALAKTQIAGSVAGGSAVKQLSVAGC